MLPAQCALSHTDRFQKVGRCSIFVVTHMLPKLSWPEKSQDSLSHTDRFGSVWSMNDICSWSTCVLRRTWRLIALYGLCLRGYGSKCSRKVELVVRGCVPLITPDVSLSYSFRPAGRGLGTTTASPRGTMLHVCAKRATSCRECRTHAERGTR